MKPAKHQYTILKQICQYIPVCQGGSSEVFFKQIKQTLQLADFLGHSRNAILWQVWMALLAYVLIRFIGYLGQWKGTFRRLFTLLRGVLFSRLDAFREPLKIAAVRSKNEFLEVPFSIMSLCGTARGSPRMICSP